MLKPVLCCELILSSKEDGKAVEITAYYVYDTVIDTFGPYHSLITEDDNVSNELLDSKTNIVTHAISNGLDPLEIEYAFANFIIQRFPNHSTVHVISNDFEEVKSYIENAIAKFQLNKRFLFKKLDKQTLSYLAPMLGKDQTIKDVVCDTDRVATINAYSIGQIAKLINVANEFTI